MSDFIPFNRDQSFLLPPDLKRWLPEDDLAHFVIAAVERVGLSAFQVKARAGGKAQYHPRLMLALLIYAYANGIFSSRRIERASYRDIGVRFVAANLHPDHDTIAAFRRANKVAFEAAFLQVLLLARESGLLRLGTVSIDGTKIDANASKIRSVRYDRAKEGRRGRPPAPPDPTPPPERQSNLTDPDSALMRRSKAHEYRQAYNAQAVVCAEGTQVILAAGVSTNASDAPGFAATILAMEKTVGLPTVVLADTGFASGPAVEELQTRGIDPLVAIGRTQPHRPYDFRPPPEPKPARRITEPWRIAMKARLETEDAKALYKLRKQTVEPVFGIIKSAIGFTRFRLRGLRKVATEWTLIALAYNCRRIRRLQLA